MWLTAIVITVLTAGAVVALWWPATRGFNGAELVSARLDALKVGLSVVVGSGGVVALYLSWRRQESTERTLAHQQEVHAATLAYQDRVTSGTEYDAAQRRLNELYLKAVEQLGSAQAAVRHGGLYALERVAQDNPSQRQTVVNVICAYLRNPLHPASEDRPAPPTGHPTTPAAICRHGPLRGYAVPRWRSRGSAAGTRGPPHRTRHPATTFRPRSGSRSSTTQLLARHRPRPHRRHAHQLLPPSLRSRYCDLHRGDLHRQC
jgi:hypothetical protein